jgi:parvulin-like peptidyl-prolyl isomerase
VSNLGQATVRRTPRHRILAGLLVAATVLAACSHPPPEEAVVATWEDGRLTRAAFDRWLAVHDLEPSADAVRRAALTHFLADAARRRGAENSPEFLLAIEADRHRILMRALENHIEEGIEIADAEVEQWREAHPEAFQRPRRLYLRGIFKRLPEEADERAEVFQRMATLRERVLDGADLAALAATESHSQNRFREGAVGFVDPEELPPAVRDAVVDLEVGDVSALVEHGGGLAFYACERIQPAVRPDAEQVRFKLRQNLFRQRRGERMDALHERLAEGITVTPDRDPVLTVGDYSLPAEWLPMLAQERIGDQRADRLTGQQVHRLLGEWGMRVALSDHAEHLGLDRAPAVAAALAWRTPRALATDELRHRVDARLRAPSEAELRALFEQRGDRLRHPAAVRVAVIQYADADGPRNPDTLETARRIQARIRSGELDFEQAAREHSILPSSANGGRLDWVTPQQLGSVDAHLLRPVRQLSPGENTGLLHLSTGLWSVKLLERREARPMSFEEAREQLVEIHRSAQIERLEAEVRERALESMDLRILVAEPSVGAARAE